MAELVGVAHLFTGLALALGPLYRGRPAVKVALRSRWLRTLIALAMVGWFLYRYTTASTSAAQAQAAYFLFLMPGVFLGLGRMGRDAPLHAEPARPEILIAGGTIMCLVGLFIVTGRMAVTN
jgi:hypothetical protein